MNPEIKKWDILGVKGGDHSNAEDHVMVIEVLSNGQAEVQICGDFSGNTILVNLDGYEKLYDNPYIRQKGNS